MRKNFIEDIAKSFFILVVGIIMLSALGTEIARQISAQFKILASLIIIISITYLIIKLINELSIGL